MVEKALQQLKIAFPEHLRGGVYANNLAITHTREEFVLDFMMIFPPAATVAARVVSSPGHRKRMLSAFKGAVEKYESQFGKLSEAAEPQKPALGFHPQEQYYL